MKSVLSFDGLLSFLRGFLRSGFFKALLKSSLRKRVITGVLVLVYMLLKRLRHGQIKVDCVKTPANLKILADLRKVLAEYSPTIYLPFSLMMMACNTKKVQCFSRYARQSIALKDGEVISIDWTEKGFKEQPASTPVIILVPGLCNDSRANYARVFCEYASRDYGFRACIMNRRGYSRMPFAKPDPDPVTWNKFADLDQVVEFVHAQFPRASIYLAGTSMGANHIQRYAGLKGRSGERLRAKALGCISSPYCLTETTRNVNSQPLIRFAMTRELVQTVVEHLHEERFVEAARRRGVDFERVLAARSSDEFNEAFSLHFTDYPSLAHYKRDVSSLDVVRHIPVPTLAVNSKNDQVVPHTAIPYSEIALNERFLQVLVSGGGHLEYFSTLSRRRWAYDLVLTFFASVEAGSPKPDAAQDADALGTEAAPARPPAKLEPAEGKTEPHTV